MSSSIRFRAWLSVLLWAGCLSLAAAQAPQLPTLKNDHDESADDRWSLADEVSIVLNGTSVSVSSRAVAVSGTTVRIQAAGTYRLKGTLHDGQIVVESEGLVRLLFDGVQVTSSRNAPLVVEKAKKTIILLMEGSTNRLTDAVAYQLPPGQDEPDAALFSKDDLTIIGRGGTLSIDGRFKDGIGAKDGLVLRTAALAIKAADDGVRGQDYVVIRGGSLTVTAGGDGIKATQEDSPAEGYLRILDGSVLVSAGDDGVQAETQVWLSGGNLDLTAVHEGISGQSVVLNGARVKVEAGEDGVSVSAGSDVGYDDGSVFLIREGSLTVDAAGDGLDLNGSGWMSGGTVTIYGPTPGQRNAPLDYNGSFAITGGVLVAVGSVAMVQAPGSGSTQNSLLVNLDSPLGAESVTRLKTSTGEDLVVIASPKAYQSILISTPALKRGTTYTLIADNTTPAAGSTTSVVRQTIPTSENQGLTVVGAIPRRGSW